MNIRSISNPAQVLAKESIESTKAIKSDETSDREGNGQQPQSDTDDSRPLNEQEVEEVIGKISAHEGVQRNGLIVKHEFINNQNIVVIEDPSGNQVRRFTESDLYHLWKQTHQDEIQLLRRKA